MRKSLLISSLILLVTKLNIIATDDCQGLRRITAGSTNFTDILKDQSLTYVCLVLVSPVNLTETVQRQKISNLIILGNKFPLTCNNDTGIKFDISQEIIIKNLSLDSCGGKFESKAVPYNGSFIVPMSSAFYFNQVSNVKFEHVKIINSNGYGLVLYDCKGTLKFFDLHVISSRREPWLVNGKEILGYASGGGLYIEYTKDGNDSYIHKNKILINNCKFRKNEAENVLSNESGRLFGKGGGISINFCGQASLNEVNITSTMFKYNRALQGAASSIFFSNESHSNTINIDGGVWDYNEADLTGGGLNVRYNGSPNQTNIIVISKINFTQNSAGVYGGSISANDKMGDHIVESRPYLSLYHCVFRQNTAQRLGTAVYLDRVSVYVQNNTFIDNDCGIGCYGALYSYLSTIQFDGHGNKFLNNDDCAFLLDYSVLEIKGGIEFRENKGTKGGALALYQRSWIVLTNGGRLRFINNKALKGGAIYVHEPEPIPDIYDQLDIIEEPLFRCFFQVNITSFNGSVEFKENKAVDNFGDDIFATTLKNCRKRGEKTMDQVISGWKNFAFSSNSSIATDHFYFNITDDEWRSKWAGEEFSPTITVSDEKNNSLMVTVDISVDLNTAIHTTHTAKVDLHRQIVKDNHIRLKYLTSDWRKSFNITISSPSEMAVSKKVHIPSLESCPFGYSFLNQKCICSSLLNGDRGISQCDGTDIYIYRNMWSKPHPNSKPMDKEKVIKCPDNYCECNKSNDGLSCLYTPTHQCSSTRNQSSLLCSKCKQGYSVKYGSSDCGPCTSPAWGMLFLVLLVSPIAFVFIILFLNIDVYEDYLNVVLYFYQVTPLLKTPNQEFDVGMKIVTGIINWKGVDGKISFCLFHGLNDMEKMFLGYTFPVISILTLLLLICCSEKPRCSRIYRKFLNRNKCYNAVVFIIIFAYGLFTKITISLLHPKSLDIDDPLRLYIYADQKYFKDEHVVYGIIASLMCIFVAMVPISIMFPEFFIRYAFFMRFKPILDNFGRCFKNDFYHQLFPAYYFICRLSLLAVNLTVDRNQEQLTISAFVCIVSLVIFSLFKPYNDRKSELATRYRFFPDLNTFDILVLSNLSLIAILSNGKRHLPINDPTDSVFYYMIVVLMWPPLVIPIMALLIRLYEFLRKRIGK